MEQEIEEQIIKNIEYIFEPICGKVVCFGEPYCMYCGIRKIGETKSIYSEENKINLSPVKIDTKLGELNINIHSTNLNDIKSAIGLAYAYSGFQQKSKMTEDLCMEIQKRIYS